MQSYTPGVRIDHVFTEPMRVLHTGVPVFLGLIQVDHLRANNARFKQNRDEQYVRKSIPGFSEAYIVRKWGHIRLPERPADDARIGDSMSQTSRAYLRSGGPRPPPSPSADEVPHTDVTDQAPDVNKADLDVITGISEKPQRFTVWPDFEATYGALKPFVFLVNAVRGFFENDGRLCYVQLIGFKDGKHQQAVEAGLKTLEPYADYDLVCVPDIVHPHLSSNSLDLSQVTAMQTLVIRHCDTMGDRLAILDSLSLDADSSIATVKAQRSELRGNNAVLYYPWLHVSDGPSATAGYLPPCGHVAGVIAQTDRRIGVHKAPANEVLEGILDLQVDLNDQEQSPLNETGINCLRAFPRRGIRVWGARTISSEPAWKYINVRRIFTTATRWIERNMANVAFEPNTAELWARIVRDLTYYFSDLLEKGALAGRSANEAFYIKCDSELNPPEKRETGEVVTEIGLATDAPAEFIVVRIMHSLTGARILGAS